MVWLPGLGNLSRLPPEIRRMIWQLLGLSVGSNAEYDTPFTRQLQGLQINRQFYSELLEFTYGSTTLIFSISPKYEHNSWFDLRTDNGISRLIKCFQHASATGITSLPYGRLKQIRINIGAPSPWDPGQLICLWKKCSDIAELLEGSCDGLARLEINLTESESQRWANDGKPHMSFDNSLRPCFDDGLMSWLDYDLRSSLIEHDHAVVLLPFARLRNVQEAKVCLPDSLSGIPDCKEAHIFAEILQDERPFGTSTRPGFQRNDEHIQKEIDLMFLAIERILDLVLSPTADLMRLDRFSSWYEDHLEHRSRYQQRANDVVQRSSRYCSDEVYREEWELGQMRLALMRLYNPLEKQQTQSSLDQVDQWRLYFGALQSRAYFPQEQLEQMLNTPFDYCRNEWRCGSRRRFWYRYWYSIDPLDGISPKILAERRAVHALCDSRYPSADAENSGSAHHIAHETPISVHDCTTLLPNSDASCK